MIDMFLVRRETLVSSLPEECREKCTLAKYVIANVCRDADSTGHGIDIEAGRLLLSQCIDGPMPVGSCGTEKTVCAHPIVDITTDTLKQRELFETSLQSL